MAKAMHNDISHVTKVDIMQKSQKILMSYEKIINIDNPSQLCVHVYVTKKWENSPFCWTCKGWLM